jgi:hypothetical protein
MSISGFMANNRAEAPRSLLLEREREREREKIKEKKERKGKEKESKLITKKKKTSMTCKPSALCSGN